MSIWYDLTPNLHDGTLFGPVFDTTGGNKSIFFDGVNDYIEINPAPNTSVSNTFTYEIWCTANATHEIDTQSTSGSAGSSGQKFIVHPEVCPISDASDIGISVGTNGVSVYEYIPAGINPLHFPPLLVKTVTIPSTTFTHIVVVVENKQPKLYINGGLVHTGLTSQKFRVYAQTQKLGGGTYGYYAGRIGMFKLYQCALTATQIYRRYYAIVSIIPAYSIVPNVTSVNEGQTVTYTITTTNIPNGTVLYWANSGSTDASDFSDANNSGSVTINSNSGTISRTLSSDLTTEGTESIILELRIESTLGPVVATATTVNVNDTSTSPTYSIVPNVTTVTEGGTVTYTVTTTSVPNGTVLYWTDSGNTVAADFASSSNTGSVTITNNTGTITRTLVDDLVYESVETMILQLRTGSTGGPVVATATTVNVADASVLLNFDYAVVRFKWTGADGVDLDTRTKLLNTGSIYDNDMVGYCQGSTVGPNPYYLTWGGDNTGSGVEAHLIDFKKVVQDFPSLANVTVELSAVWFERRYTGNVSIEFQTYLGGTMSQSGFDFVNSGGTPVQLLTANVNVVSNTTNCVAGDCLKHLVYDTATKNAVLQACP